MLMRSIFTAAMLAASTCSIICGAACDFVASGECLTPRGVFGPCVDSQCSDGLKCFVAATGNVCVTPLTGADEWTVNECAATAGHSLRCVESQGFCAASCKTQGDCASGSVCDQDNSICVHPPPATQMPPDCGLEGGMFGPCPPDSHICGPGLICLDAEPTGTICGLDGIPVDQDVLECAAFAAGGTVDCEFFGDKCYTACDADADCNVGLVCSSYGACVHPE